MARRTISSLRRPRPHLYEEDSHNPSTCTRCHLIGNNDVHIDQLPPTDPAILAEEARRYSEREET